MSSSISSSSAGPAPSSGSSQSSSLAPGRSITLRRRAQTRFVANAVDGFRFTVEAHSARNMPAEVFLYLRRSADPTTGAAADEFSNVCSAPDLAEYPTGGPTGTPPFFRAATVDLVFRSQAEAEEAWEVLQREVRVLVDTLDKGDALGAAEDVEIEGVV